MSHLAILCEEFTEIFWVVSKDDILRLLYSLDENFPNCFLVLKLSPTEYSCT